MDLLQALLWWIKYLQSSISNEPPAGHLVMYYILTVQYNKWTSSRPCCDGFNTYGPVYQMDFQQALLWWIKYLQSSISNGPPTGLVVMDYILTVQYIKWTSRRPCCDELYTYSLVYQMNPQQALLWWNKYLWSNTSNGPPTGLVVVDSILTFQYIKWTSSRPCCNVLYTYIPVYQMDLQQALLWWIKYLQFSISNGSPTDLVVMD